MPDEPLWHLWKPDQDRFRVIPYDGDPKWFNPNTGADPLDPDVGGRFHPLVSAAGAPISTFYAASHLKAALSETLLHDLSLTPPSAPYGTSRRQYARHAA